MLEYVSAAFILLGVLSPAWAAPFDGAAFVVERDSGLGVSLQISHQTNDLTRRIAGMVMAKTREKSASR